MAAVISPTVLGSKVYTVSASRRLVVDLDLHVVSAVSTRLELRFPAAAAGVKVVLRHDGVDKILTLTAGQVVDSATFAGRELTVTVSAIGTQIRVSCEIRALAMELDEVWSVQAQADTAQTWRFTQNDDSPVRPTITRLMGDPACELTVTAPSLTAAGTILEKDTVTVKAVSPFGAAAAPTVVGAPLPPVSYRFDKTGTLTVPGLPACSAADELTLPLPPVTADEAIAFTHDVWFDSPCPAVGFLTSSAPPKPVTVRWNPPWTLTPVTPGPLTLKVSQPTAVQFTVGGRPGTTAHLMVETLPPVGGTWSPTGFLTVTPGASPVGFTFTPAAGIPSGTRSTFVGRLSEPATGETLATSVPITFEVKRDPPTGG